MSPSLLARRQGAPPIPVCLALMAAQAFCFSHLFTVQLIYQIVLVGLVLARGVPTATLYCRLIARPGAETAPLPGMAD